MNGFQSFLRFIGSASAVGLVLGFLAIIVLLPFIIFFIGVVVFWSWWKHHNRTCQHFSPQGEYIGLAPRRRRTPAMDTGSRADVS